ncbi:hypothetical protein [Sphingomonas rubra]|uniref:hypothetical protein n=1 Tax=Sphingomonas rubra TaxID=634430 RepID=UPI001160D216|nr:hypothetical protein [Sphingomonas rubra]
MRISDDTSGGRWFILRTSGGNTLPLITSLCEAGHDAWSPAHTLRRGVKAATPSGTREIEVRLPILPTFAFIRATVRDLDREAQLSDLVAMGRQSPSPFPPFSVFHHAGRAPMIHESEIAGLRQEETDKAALIQAIRSAETHAEAEAIRIAAIKSASARRRAEAAAAREERRVCRQLVR